MTNPETSGWLHRLRERGVIRVAASYAVIAWLLLQIADVTFGPLGVPGWVMVSLIVAAVLGFPVAVALAWFYEAGGSGVTRDTAAEGVPRPVVPGLRRYADVAIIAVLLAAVAVLLVRQSDLGPGGARGLAIAVLPFQNLSTSRDAEVLASGIAESVLHQLASLAELDVISRTSSFAFRDRAEDAREIGRQLGARYLLEGSVQSEPARMRVTTQLIDTETGSDVWSMRFDRRPGDVFAIQDEIAVQVTQALELSLDPEAKERMTGQGTTNLQAYLAFLQGRALLATGNVTEVKAATEHFERSVALDPKFPAAYVNLAQAELFVAEFEVTDDRQARFAAALERGNTLVQKALSLDPENGDAVLQRAHLAAYTNLAAAEADYRRGLELSPNSAEGFAGLASVLYETPGAPRRGARDARSCPKARPPRAGPRRDQIGVSLARTRRYPGSERVAGRRTKAPSRIRAGARAPLRRSQQHGAERERYPVRRGGSRARPVGRGHAPRADPHVRRPWRRGGRPAARRREFR